MPDGSIRYSTLAVVGFSNGRGAAVEFAEKLRDRGTKVYRAFTIDPVPKGGELVSGVFTLGLTDPIFFQRPKNISPDDWWNFFQRTDHVSLGIGIKGKKWAPGQESRIRLADRIGEASIRN